MLEVYALCAQNAKAAREQRARMREKIRQMPLEKVESLARANPWNEIAEQVLKEKYQEQESRNLSDALWLGF